MELTLEVATFAYQSTEFADEVRTHTDLKSVSDDRAAMRADVIIRDDDEHEWEFPFDKTFVLIIADNDRKPFDSDFSALVRCYSVKQSYHDYKGKQGGPDDCEVVLRASEPHIQIELEWPGNTMPFKYSGIYTAILREKALI